MRFIEQRKVELLHIVSTEMTKKTQSLKNQITNCEEKAYKAKGLIEYSMEVLREADPSSFLLVRSGNMHAEPWNLLNIMNLSF